MASYMDNEAIVDETFDDEARDRPPANKQKGKRKRKMPPKSAEFVQDSDDETSIEATSATWSTKQRLQQTSSAMRMQTMVQICKISSSPTKRRKR